MRELRQTMQLGLAVTVVGTLALVFPDAALAHDEGELAVGLWNGLKHPISGLDHVVAMIAVGLWGAQLGKPEVWILPIVFPVVMAFGGLLGLLGVPVPGIEIGIALSAIVLGIMVLGEVEAPIAITAVIVGFFAIFHGVAHGNELPGDASGIAYSVGFVVATGMLHAVGIAIGLVHRWPIGRRALQAAGAGVAVVGVVFLLRALG